MGVVCERFIFCRSKYSEGELVGVINRRMFFFRISVFSVFWEGRRSEGACLNTFKEMEE